MPAQGSPALPTVHVTAWLCQLLHARPGAVAVLAADEGVAAEGLGLTDDTLWLQGVWRADALPCHLITQTCATFTGCEGQREGCVWGSKNQAGRGKHKGMDAELNLHVCRFSCKWSWKMQPLPK